MTTFADKAILSGADNRPPMLEKDMYDSWKSRMELYTMNRQHRVTRPKKYFELSATEAIQADCDIKATNIILQGLPPEVTKELWERIQLLMQGTSLMKQERECKLYDEFDKTYIPRATRSNSGKQRTATYYNCKGEGHMSKQCTKPNRKRDDSWFKDKVLLKVCMTLLKETDRERAQLSWVVLDLRGFWVEIPALLYSGAKVGRWHGDAAEKVLEITALKDDLRKLKGKALVDNVVTKHTIDPEMLKIDVEPITPKLLNKKTAHSAYIKHTQEEATVLRDLVEHVKSKYPLDHSLESAYSRPDLQFVICMCARYQARPTEKHLHAVERIFRCLKGTINRGLWYPKDSSIVLTAFPDADHVGCQDTRRSTFGSMQLLWEIDLLLSSKRHRKGHTITITEA
ncbi:retrovirus-related pol polyprotein from transposon TNT 1-94 [Tanacetum coccineum]